MNDTAINNQGNQENQMNHGADNIPHLRFPEFEGEWEKKKLGEVAEINRGKSKHRPRDAEFLYGGKYPFIQTGDIRNAGLYLDNYSQTYSEEGLKQSKLWDENTLCITIAANIAETTILKIKACFPDSVIGLIPKKDKTTVLFVKNQFDKFKIDIQKLSQGMAQANLNQERLSNIEFHFPTLPEQTRIAQFFTAIDQKITQLKQKKNLLEQYKKGVMQSIFNHDSLDLHDEPDFEEDNQDQKSRQSSKSQKSWFRQFRFKDDNGKEFPKWKKKRIDQFAPLQRGFDLPITQIKEGNFPVVFSNGILKTHSEFKAKAPGVVTGRSGTIGNVTYVEQDYWPHNTALWVTDFKGNLPLFVFYFYSFYNLERFGTGSGVPTLNRNDVHSQIEFFPCLAEQIKIANFLSALDEKINHCQKQIEKTEQWKKGLLQQMFC